MKATLDNITAPTPAGDPPAARRRTLYDQIAQLNLFKGLSPQHLEMLADCAMRIKFNPGELIFQEGFPANRFYVILSGSVALMSANQDAGLIPVQTVGPGEDLGWSWLFPPYYSHFTARATEPTEAIFFYGTRLRDKCDRDHDFGYEITQRVAMVVIESLQSLRKQLILGSKTPH